MVVWWNYSGSTEYQYIYPTQSQYLSQAFSGEAQCFIDQYGNYTVPELIDVLGDDAHVRVKHMKYFPNIDYFLVEW